MKILILFDIARRADPEETFAERALKEEDKPTELDVLKCLKRLGHEVETLAVFDNVAAIVEKLTTYAPDVVFNLTESFYHDRSHEPNIPALLELMKVRYTGSGPEALLLCKDKALAKKVLTYHRVRLPRFVVSHKARPLRRLRRFTFPAFVKPVSEESSDGISQASLVKGEEEAIERARFIHQKFNCDALIEEYVDGREMYVGVLGNDKPEALPVVELDLSKLPDGTPRIASAEVKWGKGTKAYRDTKSAIATDLSEETIASLQQTAVAAYQALELRDYGRVDMRLQPDGRVQVIEVNPNPWLSSRAEFAMAARKSGRTYPQLVAEIVELASSRA